MSETQALPASVARYTSQIVAAYCERNGVNISDMEDVAVAISKTFVGIAAQFSATAVAQKSASTAERAEPQKTIRFPEERLNRSGYPGTAAVGAGGSATLAVPGGRDPAVQPAHPNLALEPEAAAARRRPMIRCCLSSTASATSLRRAAGKSSHVRSSRRLNTAKTMSPV